ncbi:MAG: hypothetical protein EP319_14280 [Deltaproteobacteria bacterium]|nr:MAG: hypothetical protein EP319_14280 [Deltaproteobacteria bacterium]
MKATILLILLTVSNGIFAQAKGPEKNDQMSKRWHTLNNLINQEIKTIKSIGRIGPKLQHRLLELNSERIKLLKEQENQVFLSSPKSLIKEKGKDWFFRKSFALFKKVRNDGHKLINEFPRFRHKAGIFYTLALNERDYGGDKKTEFYLLQVLKHAQKGDKIIHHAKTSLAEYHYNQKNYKTAIRYYDDVVQNTKDDWYTKHLYNQAWCLLKERQYEKGIENLRTAFEFSKNPNYVSVKDQVLEAFAVFFVHGNQISEGIAFYLGNLKDPTDYLISMARKTANKGLFKETRDVISASLGKARELKLHSKEVDIRLLELEIYRNFKKFDLHFETSLALQQLQEKKAFSPEQKEDATNKLKSLVNYLQVRVTKNRKASNGEYDKKLMKEVISYFDILSTIDAENKDSYNFFSGETHFAVGNFKAAADFYKSSIENGLNKKGKEADDLRRKTLNSFLATLGKSDFDKKQDDQYTIFAYENHIKFWPKDEKSRVIYVKLYNLQLGKNNVDGALGTFNLYNKTYKQDAEIQRGMITHLMDFYIKTKNSVALAQWIEKFEKGFLGFKRDYVEKALAILGQILFEQYEGLEKAGKKDLAIKGYQELYKDERYPNKIKAQSAYNASVLYLEMAQTEKSFEWVQYSMQKHQFDDLKKLLPKMKGMAERYAFLQDFKRSALLSKNLLSKFCSIEIEGKNDLYISAVHHHLLDGDYRTAVHNTQLGSKCGIDKKESDNLNKQIIGHLASHRHYREFFDFYNKHKGNELYFDTFSAHLINIYWDTKFTSQPKLHSSVSNILMNWKKQNKLPEIFAKNLDFMDQYNQFEKLVNSIKFNLPKFEKFDQEKFNLALEENLTLLQSITKDGEALIKQGHKEMTLLTYSLLEKQYQRMAKAIETYTPAGMPNEFVVGFKKHMGQLSGNLMEKSHSYNSGARTVIEKNDILSFNNFKFIKTHQFVEKVNYRYPASRLVSTADLGGDQ